MTDEERCWCGAADRTAHKGGVVGHFADPDDIPERERDLELAYEREMEERQDAHERFLLSPGADYLFENGRGE